MWAVVVVVGAPCRILTILTDNGVQFSDLPRNRNTAYSRQMSFDMICGIKGIEHQLTKPPPLDKRPGRADEPKDWSSPTEVVLRYV